MGASMMFHPRLKEPRGARRDWGARPMKTKSPHASTIITAMP
eukprot:CAMPEP_0172510836 /NCGR_PEP_ID=MMETSP1066-20121228/231808_1 /TAXON_ID=671091 /ORGANISM="Coscinodiscus wailesii, Strain CCMP2513" /LENGTH=41 /DNA_ID= /DNA_START= /DNA_END= /DNA_ORIENTATION=